MCFSYSFVIWSSFGHRIPVMDYRHDGKSNRVFYLIAKSFESFIEKTF